MPQAHPEDSSRHLLVLLLIVLAVGVGAPACSHSTGYPLSPTSATLQQDATSTGTLSVMMTDTPFGDAMAVFVTISEVSVRRTGSDWQAHPLEGGTITCDLKQLKGPVDLLGGTPTAGKYTQIRLTIDRAAIYFDNPAALTDACAATPTVDETSGPTSGQEATHQPHSLR